MVVFKKAADIGPYLKDRQQPLGFVPTMGALHAGHRSLLARAKAEGCLVICSIFINPTQFNDQEDYLKYPVSIEKDIELLLEAGCDVLFLPAPEEVYPHGFDAAKSYDFGKLEDVLEGSHRPGHFRGVGQVVGRLLEIVQPDRLYMGQKDYQQCLIINKLLEQMHSSINMIMGDTVREEDGLAMSSRNRRLSEASRTLAGSIYQCLVSIKTKQGLSPFSIVQKECMELLKQKGFEPEYVALADSNDLSLIDDYDPGRKEVALIAAKLNGVRLIDNILLNRS